jgi:asparagine synthase (glutamine-hydrolysing)
MCGINGEVHRDQTYPINDEQVLARRDLLTHRGPDDAGCYFGAGVALGSRRLSILDLSPRGHMPMSTVDGRFWIVYNGEIYNFGELRLSLEQRGCQFVSNTDTEVLLQLYAVEGPAMLTRLNGMFAVAIWDSRERTLFLARDRVGVKPLYYVTKGESLYFASEEKALFNDHVKPEFCSETLEELLCFRYVAGEQTPYRHIKRLLPGHYLLWRDGELRITRWWKLADRIKELRESLPSDPLTWFRETFDDAVRLRLISDVPVGVLLSGGLDSGSIASSTAQQTTSHLAAFTVRFTEASYDEGPLARQVADKWGLQLHELFVSPDELLPRLISSSWLNDEPLVHGNDLHLGAISEFAKPRVTVLLSGEGSDETLGGYVRYQPLRHPMLLAGARPFFPKIAGALKLNGRLQKLSRFLELGGMDRFVLFNSCDALPDELRMIGLRSDGRFPFREQVLREAQEAYPNEPVRQAMYSDQHAFLCSILDRNDRMTMGASIECRVPFLDYRLVEGLAALPTKAFFDARKGKKLLRQSIGARLPDAVLSHHKWGFGVPWVNYFRTVPDLRALLESLPDIEPFSSGALDRDLTRTLIKEFLNGKNDHAMLVRQLFMVGIWHAGLKHQSGLSFQRGSSSDRGFVKG